MFSNYKHDSPNNYDILLCAGPKERQALADIMSLHVYLWNAEDFISELHKVVQSQANHINDVNSEEGTELLSEKDAGVSFDRHLSVMCQEDVDKVFRHLRVLFIDRCNHPTGVNRLDHYFKPEKRKNIYETIIVPWLNWVRSIRQDKSTIEVSDKSISKSETNSSDNKSDKEENNKPSHINKKPNNTMDNNTFNQFKNEFESQFGIDPDAEITLYATEAEQYALQQALEPYMASDDADELIRDIHSMLYDDLPDGDTCFSKLSRSEVEDVLECVDSLVTDEVDTLDSLENFDDEQRKNMYNDIIKPWFQWLKQSKKDSSKKANNKKSNTTTNNTNMNNNTTTNNTNMNNNTTTTNMVESLTSTFANMLGKLEPDMTRITFDGKIAVKTTKGYKTYDVVKKKAINMDSLVMPDMSAFLLLPSTKVKVGDIILRDGTFYSIISIDDATNELVGYNYESGKKETLVRETHCFLGSIYFYSKLFSPVLSFFGNKPKKDAKKEEGAADAEVSEDITSTLLPLAMMSQNGDMNSILPLMLMSKMEGKEDSGMLKMLMLSGMMGGGNSNMNNLLPFMMMSGNFPAI